ncbi:MAG TPA: flagellar hook-basal body complex protein, partial [Calditrichia bacterium]|nr:flagellar hook-basal body complex protein [Calditrichia bacterium]
NTGGTRLTNPTQVGLGVQVSSIDRMFAQGALQSTGNVTDLAIEGEGFFVLRNGDENFYTRAGNFYIDANGNLLSQRGMQVQGWMLNSDEEITNFGPNNISDVILDSNISSEAVATENIFLSGNLDAGLEPDAQIWTSSTGFTLRASLLGTVLPATSAITAGTNDEFVIDLSGGSSTATDTITLTANAAATVDDLVADINTQIAASSELAGLVEAVNNGGAIQLRSLDQNSNATITVNSGTNDALATLGFSDGDTASANATASATVDLNDLLQTATNYADGDEILIRGTNPDGSVVDVVFTYGAANDGTSIQDVIDTINASFTGVTAELVDGQLVVTDDVPGDSETTISLANGAANVGTINLPGFSNTQPGYTGKASTSVIVYDSLGGAHNLVFEFIKTGNPGEWTWEATTSGDETVISGGTGRAVFNEFGVLTSFSYDNGVNTLEIDPGNDATNMIITINPNGDGEFSGMSQFESTSTVNVREQDGRANGTLQGLLIDEKGVLTGTFSNGETISLARIAIAQFGNQQGLVDLGDGLNAKGVSSGEPDIFSPNENRAVSIIAGSLEQSNVDLSREFTELIVAQRGFQANAKVITTSDTIIGEVINIKR